MPQPGTPSRVVLSLIWLGVGAAMIGVPAWLFWTRWPTMLSSHPALMATALVCAMIGIVAVVWAVASLAVGGRYDREGDPDHPRYRTREQQLRRARIRIGLAVPALAACGLLMAGLAWVRPFAATDVAVAALRSGAGLRVSDRVTWYELTRIRRDDTDSIIKPSTGLIFIPGARVDPRAYAHILRPAAEAGYLVAVIKEPFNLALPNSTRAEAVMEVHPEIRYWSVAGHSLGGVTAAAFSDTHPDVDGLLLYASYAATPMQRTDIKTVSVSGDQDGLTTPADIEETKTRLPPTAGFVVVKGAVHSFFGDYGEQPGDGTPTVDRAAAQAAISKATVAHLKSLTPPPKKK